MRAVKEFSMKGSLGNLSMVSAREDAVELREYALEEDKPIFAASCLQVFLFFLRDLPDCLNEDRVV
ncbi:hypothetical protein I3842_08G036700 [Carya illinoinensis]|uniref:Uncharacterized protein n=1 Tax=Carya illinoinensis TaxID=32201 RepID=A0A922J9R7_CARIL|nr:hypothetical protein I3842_08G036700 [Carya illinoinensis]